MVERCAAPHLDRLHATRVPQVPGVVALVAGHLVEVDDAYRTSEDARRHVEPFVLDGVRVDRLARDDEQVAEARA
jgi:hypothetical protein